MGVLVIKSDSEFQTALANPLVIVDFTAAWCGPCKAISPVFEQLSNKNPEIKFIKVDVDELKEVARTCKVSSMPTFQFFKSGVKVDEVKGADKNALEQMIAKYSEKIVSSPSPIPGQMNLEQFIMKNQLECLNADPKTYII
jgi:thioredoxin